MRIGVKGPPKALWPQEVWTWVQAPILTRYDWKTRVCFGCINSLLNMFLAKISRPHTTDFPQKVAFRKGNPLILVGNLGWWNSIFWPDCFSISMVHNWPKSCWTLLASQLAQVVVNFRVYHDEGKNDIKVSSFLGCLQQGFFVVVCFPIGEMIQFDYLEDHPSE